MNNKSLSKLVAVLAAGAGAGAVAWYFMKSEKGKENWGAIIDAVKDFSDALQEKASAHKDKLNGISEKASDFLTTKATEASAYARNSIEDIASKAAKDVEVHS